jgi:anhydro-N-acetylmuramic acid kinase
MGDLYIGLISGTSMDGIDCALVGFSERALDIVATLEHPYPGPLRARLATAIENPDSCTVDDVGSLDRAVGVCFRDAALALLAHAGVAKTDIAAIGSHGQTLRHQPHATQPFTLQIGDPAVIATGTGITTVADFRRADIALGGEGAPLAPAFHDWLLRAAGQSRCVVNIGGIANITVLPGDETAATGYDTGPGNTLLDAWVRHHMSKAFDRDGVWAAEGEVDSALLARLLSDPYFSKAPPKSTGLEYFNLEWLNRANVAGLKPVDVQATLCELTATSIADALRARQPALAELHVCGGGVHNQTLMRRLRDLLPATRVGSTMAIGLDPDWVEAAAFAWLAMRRMTGQPGNLPSVTGAKSAAMLGAIHAAG